MNTTLLRKVKQLILEEPRRLEMCLFAQKDGVAPCGTVACIAGWAVIEHDREKRVAGSRRVTERYLDARNLDDNGAELGAEVLELTEQQASRLFYTRNWPETFQSRWCGVFKPEDEAQVAADRIDHFLKTNGAE